MPSVAVIGAGLYTRTLHNLRSIDLGINIHNLTVFRLAPSVSGYSNEQDADYAQRVLARLESVPGVQSAALQTSGNTEIDVPGVASQADRHVSAGIITAHFFETMGIPVLLGRGIEAGDRAGAPRVAVINEALARAYFAHESPVGKHFRAQTRDYEIVGVVRDSKWTRIREAAPPTFFVSYPQTQSNCGG